MIRSVLIANRGEIARRIIRTARRLGVRTVAVFSETDDNAPHVKEADAAVCIGPAPARESYLVGERILEAARETGVAAIHPGYGFLSENADFAEAVIGEGLIWVGAPPAAIRTMGRKDAAKRLMAQAGVPVTPGYLGDDQDPARLATEAALIGWPVLIKAVAGGGGKGMRKVERADAFDAALVSARREAASAFGDDRVLLEKYVEHPRHIEVQVFGDSEGRVVHLFERDCSLQRRHQKVIEEAPAPGMDEATRQALCATAVKAAHAVGYQGAGTVEFIADGSQGLRADRIWFMEMNTRLQVEHPVTEAVTGLDLVEWQLRVASGEPLPLSQDRIALNGHAIEARLYAEDPANTFLPSIGALATFDLPGGGVRADSSVEAGSVVSPYYDPMLGKLIVHAPTRTLAAEGLAAACRQVRAGPVKTNAWFLARCLADADFVRGAIDTGFIDARLASLTARPAPSSEVLAAAAGAIAQEAVESEKTAKADPWSSGLFGFRAGRAPGAPLQLYGDHAAVEAIIAPLAGGAHAPGFSVAIGDEVYRVGGGDGRLEVNGEPFWTAEGPSGGRVVFDQGAAFNFAHLSPAVDDIGAASDGAIRSPMPGKVVSIALRPGDRVVKGSPLVTIEAMKMEHALEAPFDGEVAEVSVRTGDQVAEGAVLIRLNAAA